MEAENVHLDDKTKRMRDLLSSFYSPDANPSTNTAKLASLDIINSPAFDADLYMNLLLEKSNLAGLLQRHVEMAAEIKNLDTDLQMLVYENYSKFINATETIKRMNSNIVGLEANMEQLLEKIMSVQSKSDTINTSLIEKRVHVEKLHQTRNLLHKVQFIYDLPSRLKACIKSEAYADAVRFFIGAMPILERYGSSSFHECKRQSEEVMMAVTRNLQAKVFSDSEPIAVRAEAVALLEQLKFPVDSLKSMLLEQLELLLLELQIGPRTSSTIEELADQSKIGIVTEVTSSPQESTIMQVSFDRFTEKIRTCRIIFPDSEGRLIDLTRALFVRHFEALQQQIGNGISSLDLLEMLRVLWRDAAMMDEVLSEAALPSFILEAARDSFKSYITRLFSNLLLDISDILTTIQMDEVVPKENSLKITLDRGKKTVIQGSMDLLLAFRQLLDNNIEVSGKLNDLIVNWVQEGFLEFFRSLDGHFHFLIGRSLSGRQDSVSVVVQRDKVHTGLVLILSQISFFIEQVAIPRISEEIAISFSGGMYDKNGPSFVPDDLCLVFHCTGEKFLHHYINMKFQKLSNLLRKRYTMTNWIKHKEPREVHVFVDLFLDEVKSIKTEVAWILPYGVHRHHRSDSAGSANSSRSNTVHEGGISRSSAQRSRSQFLESHLAKLFKQKIEIFTKAESTQVSVVSAILKRCLKSFQELVRLQTFNRSGFQQVQLDIQFLRNSLSEMAEDDAAVEFLLDEVIVAAAERCHDAVPLETPILDKLMKDKISRAKEGGN